MRGFFLKKLFLFFICVTFVSTPFLVFSQEVVAPDNSTPVEQTENTTETTSTTEPEINTTETESTDTESQPESNISNPTTSTSTETKSEEEPKNNQTANITEAVNQIIKEEPQPKIQPKPEKKEETPLKELTRVYEKEIFVNKDAKHECKAEFFKVDMSERNSALNTILLTKETDIPYEIEVGSLPIGFDIKFSESNSYQKNLGSTQESIDIDISKKSNATKGNFTVSLIYTQKGVFDSSVICQINLVNL